MKRFLCDPLPTPSHSTELNSVESKHCIRVLRLKSGDEVHAFDGKGNAALCQIKILNDQNVLLLWVKDKITPHKPKPIILEMAIIKPSNLEWVIEKITELNVSEIRFFISEHCSIRPKKLEFDKILHRLEKISNQSLKQCLRPLALKINPELKKIDSLFPCKKNSLRIIANPLKNNIQPQISLLEFLAKENNQLKNIENLFIMIGPEGGFGPQDELLFKNENVTQVSLGNNILRAETAALYASSICTSIYDILDLDKNLSIQ